MTLFKLTKDGVQKFNTVYSYDKLDRVQSITNGTNVSSYTYDRNGRLSESTTNGTTTTYGYNRAGWVTSLATQSGSSQLQSHNYQYYPDGNISEKQSTVGTLSEQVSYQYDDAGRLVREQIGNDITEFTYDNYSNRATMTSGSTTNTYTYDANNRLLKAVKTENNVDEITNYIYDNNGNQIAWYKGSISPSSGTSSLTLTDETDGTDYGYYTYDAFNRLSTYTNGVTNASYTYGADNLRKSKTVDGVTTNYTWNGSDMVLEEKGTQTNRYYYGADGIAFANLNGTTNYYQKNAHGDITALTDANGTITRNYQFDAFGNELTNNVDDINPFRYAGEYIDNETGLIYLRNRYYDSNNGRFITEDPIKDGLNWYVYCSNNPVNLIDPNGLSGVRTDGTYYITHPLDLELLKLKQEYVSATPERQAQIAIEAQNIRNSGEVDVDWSVRADRALDYYMIDTDITQRLNNVIKSSESENWWKRFAEINPTTNAARYADFALMVMPGGKYDLKSKSEWKGREHFIYNGEIVWFDEPGNILYGHLGKVMGFEDNILKAAGGVVQILQGRSRWEFTSSYFDDPRDQKAIQKGIDLFKSTHSRIWW